MSTSLSSSLLLLDLSSLSLVESSERGRFTPVRVAVVLAATAGFSMDDANGTVAGTSAVGDPFALVRRDSSELQSSHSHSIVLQSNLPHPMWIPFEPQEEHSKSSHLLYNKKFNKETILS
jgi:hypothetical protein